MVVDAYGQVNYYIEEEATQKRQLVHVDRLKPDNTRETQSREAVVSAPSQERPPPVSDLELLFGSEPEGARAPDIAAVPEIGAAKVASQGHRCQENAGRGVDPGPTNTASQGRRCQEATGRDVDPVSGQTTPEPLSSSSDSDSSSDISDRVQASDQPRRYPVRDRRAPARFSP